MHDLLATFFAVLAGIFVYRYHREILAAVKRFDDRNRARIDAEENDRSDSLAHFRHTLKLAEEQIEAVSEKRYSDSRTATPLVVYIFEGERFASRREAERVRAEKVRAKARAFYTELPVALTSRDDDRLN